MFVEGARVPWHNGHWPVQVSRAFLTVGCQQDLIYLLYLSLALIVNERDKSVVERKLILSLYEDLNVWYI